MDEEIHFHLRELTDRLIETGWAPIEAAREAERRFGSEVQVRDECAAIEKANKGRIEVGQTLRSIVQDIRFSIRSFRKQPTFSGFALGSLALGIGANIVVFTLLFTVLFEPLPYPDESRLFFVEETSPAWNIDRMYFSYPDLMDVRDQNSSFEHLAGFRYSSLSITDRGGGAERVMGCLVSSDFLEALGVQPIIGRGFRPEDEGEGAVPVALISAGLWQSRFGGDPGVVGQLTSVGGEPTVIVGVLPSFFRFPDASDLWVPFRLNRTENRGRNGTGVVGRLRPGIRVEDAEADLGRITLELGETHWGNADALGAMVTPLRIWLLGDWKSPAVALYAVVSLVLLLACANVASLFIARNTTRRQEMAVRVSLGAGRSRILRQLLTEGVTLSIVGGILGAFLGLWGRDLLLGLSPVDLPPYLSFSLHPMPMVIITGIIVGCGLLFSLGPAIASSRTDVAGKLRSESGQVSGHGGGIRLRSALVVLELAMALAVLIGGGLMFKSLLLQMQVDPGFDPDGLVTLRLDLPEATYPEPNDPFEFQRRVLEEVGAIPGIGSVALTASLPTGRSYREGNIYPEGADLGSGKAPIYPVSIVSREYFAAMGIPFLQGRDFSEDDLAEGAARTAIVNQAFARRHWPGENPIGKRIARDDGPPAREDLWATVIGVVGNTFTDGFGEPIRPMVVWPFRMEPATGFFLVARTTVTPQSSFEEIRGVIQSVDPGVPISLLRSMDRALLEANWQVRFYTWLLGIFSLLAVFLASVGVYGVMSFVVSSRSREFSLRMALGAEPGQVEGLVLRRSVLLSALGLTLGLLTALFGARLMSGMLFQVSTSDPQVFILATMTLAVVALLAGYVPARRALRLNPMSHLRGE